MEKKWVTMRLRMTENMAIEIRRGAEQEDRDYSDQIRHVLRIGLEQKRVHATVALSGAMKPPVRHRCTPEFTAGRKEAP